MHAMDATDVSNQGCQFWSKLRCGYVQLNAVLFWTFTLTDIFQVIYANCIVNVMRHSFAVPGSEQGRCGSLHPNKSVAGQTSIGSHANAPFLKGSSSVSNGYLRSGQWTTLVNSQRMSNINS